MTQVNFRIDDELKRNVEQLYKRLGLTLSAAFTLFANQSLACHGLPFVVRERGFTEWDDTSDREQIKNELAFCSRYARENEDRLSSDEVFGGIRERIHAGRRLHG